MNVWRIFYAILWLLTLIVYSAPWAIINGEPYTGWGFTVPFSFTYLIGMLIGLIVLIVKYKPVLMTIIAGILMILGLIGAFIGLGVTAVLGGLAGAKVEPGAGLGAAFLLSIIYMIAGSYAGKKMAIQKTRPEQHQQAESRVFACPKCGSSNVIGYEGKWECMDCGHKFEAVSRPIRFEKVSSMHTRTNSGKGKWIAAIIIVFIIGMIFGIATSPGQTTTRAITFTQTITTTLTMRETIAGETSVPVYTPSGKDLIIRIGEPSVIDDWEILVKSVKEVDYICKRYGEHLVDYYAPKQGMKIVLMSLRITNRAEDIREPSVIRVLMLVTDKGKIYEEITTFSLESVPYDKVTPDIKSKAEEYVELDLFDELAPDAYVEGNVMFQIPIKESPHKIYIKIEEEWPKLAVIPIEA